MFGLERAVKTPLLAAKGFTIKSIRVPIFQEYLAMTNLSGIRVQVAVSTMMAALIILAMCIVGLHLLMTALPMACTFQLIMSSQWALGIVIMDSLCVAKKKTNSKNG